MQLTGKFQTDGTRGAYGRRVTLRGPEAVLGDRRLCGNSKSKRLGYSAAQETLLNIEVSEASTRCRQLPRLHQDKAFE
jgi:hypothetical protein